MEANAITLFRICMVFVTVGLFQVDSLLVQGAAVLMVVLVLYLDALDGVVARKLNISSDFGALFDITGDRIVENVFWIYFAATGMVSFWVPMVFIARGFLTDAVRAVAFRGGKTPFGKKTMMKSPFTRFLVASRFSRGIYGGMKVVVFTLLGAIIMMRTALAAGSWGVLADAMPAIVFWTSVLVYVTVAMCIIRGLPVLSDGRKVLFQRVYPGDMDRT